MIFSFFLAFKSIYIYLYLILRRLFYSPSQSQAHGLNPAPVVSPFCGDEEIKAAAEFVDANHFIDKLPEGYDAPVSERGSSFSTGQRQLLAFARTVASQPKILILDEATANIDSETEAIVQNSLAKMRQGRTTIAIAHRLSTIQDANCIYVLDKGRIIEHGSHEELLALGGTYHKMYSLQAGAMEGA